MLIQYRDINLSAGSRRIIDLANDIIAEYEAQGITLTLRALYYRFVSRFPLVLDPSGLHPNTQKNYKRLGDILNKGRLAGLVSWLALQDRTRNLAARRNWEDPEDFLRESPNWYRSPMWDNQPYRLEVWVEKDAAIGTIEGVCERNDVPYFSCRGNVSASEMWTAGRRFEDYADAGQIPGILYLGDHDPSGMDMTRDVQERMSLFAEHDVLVQRLLLNWDQIERYAPPPNPVKTTDSRSRKYEEEHGSECWELDALDPSVVVGIIQRAVDSYRDETAWAEAVALFNERKEVLDNLIAKALY